MSSQLETRLQSRLDRREVVDSKHQGLLAERGDGNLSDTDKSQLEVYRSEISELDTEIEQLTGDLEAHNRAMERSMSLRKAMVGATDGVDVDDDGVVYRDFASYARDVILSRESTEASKIVAQAGGEIVRTEARQRLNLLKRTPANTLSSNVAGLIPAQHIAQIFQVIDNSRPIVASARRSTLERGSLTYPRVDTRPVVAVQSSEKTEAGNTGLAVSMQTATASTYLGGGDLSWQAINWSTPDALQLWFDLAAADYALKTEQDAAQAMQHSGFTYNVASTLGATPTYAQFLAGVAASAGELYSNSGRLADTIYLAPDRFFYVAGLTSDQNTSLINPGGLSLRGQGGNIGGLNVVVSRGMDSGVMVVGDSQALLVAETAGAPVELRVVEPAIGGVEVGIIGAFEAVVVDPGAFVMLTTAS